MVGLGVAPSLIAASAIWHACSVESPGLQVLAAEAMVQRCGVSYADAIRRLEFQDATVEIAETIHALLGDRAGGMWFDHDDDGRLRVAVERDGAITGSAVDQVIDLLAAHGLTDGADVVPVDYSQQELIDAHSTITGEIVDLYRAGKISSGLDPRENALHIDMATTVVAADRTRLQRLAERAPVRVKLRHELAAAVGNAPQTRRCFDPVINRGGTSPGTVARGSKRQRRPGVA
jgi:hypothetical protein